jgi:hypothetical protein
MKRRRLLSHASPRRRRAMSTAPAYLELSIEFHFAWCDGDTAHSAKALRRWLPRRQDQGIGGAVARARNRVCQANSSRVLGFFTPDLAFRLVVSPNRMLSCLSLPKWLISVPRILSLAFDLLFFSSLAILILGIPENEFAFLSIAFVFSGMIVQAILFRRFRLLMRSKELAVEKTKICPDCNRAISADARIC